MVQLMVVNVRRQSRFRKTPKPEEKDLEERNEARKSTDTKVEVEGIWAEVI